ncbi:MAG TPA: LamG domain-containing protein, partial [Ferruginibacter sp.]|nr:LamG domain-containing protein [Ferruginibacter sp.]
MRKVTLFILFCTFISNVFSQVNLNNGLVAYYPFNGNANDQSGNNINGVINSATTTTDKYGQLNSAYYFNGSTAYIQLPYSNLYNFSPQDSFSISVDVLPDAGNAWPAQAIVVKSPSNPDFNASAWNYGTYVLNYKAMSGYAATHVVNGSTIFTTNPCWYNIIVTYKNGIWNLYVNGILEDQDLSQTKFILQDGPASKIALGKKGESFGDFFKGKMDEVRIYHRVLNNDEILALSSCNTVLTCNNWLETPSYSSSITVGDIDIPGNQLTVEAMVNVNSAWGNAGFGKLVSKHTGPSDVNYSLMPFTAEITTTNGYINTPVTCLPQKDKLYHVAMVYDGTTLKFYRNGFLLSSISWTGDLITNDFLTTIGEGSTSPSSVYQHYGYLNEIRIWNVARTQAEIRQY